MVNYNRPMGGYKPHFEGVPEDYYPASSCDIILMILFVTFMIAGILGVMIGFVYWELAVGTRSFVNVWVIVLCVFVGVMFVTVYFGGKVRIK
jgi:hypothetical protein